MRRLLQPLAVESFALDPENRVFRLAPEARKAFALGVVREAGFDFMPAGHGRLWCKQRSRAMRQPVAPSSNSMARHQRLPARASCAPTTQRWP